MSGSQRGWVASGALAAVVAGGYLGVMPLLASVNAGPAWPTPLPALATEGQVVSATFAPEAGDAPRTLVKVTPPSGATVARPKPAIKRRAATPSRRPLVRYVAPAAEAAPAPPAPAVAVAPVAPVAPAASRPAPRPKPKPAPAPPSSEVIAIDAPALAADEPQPVDQDPVTAGSGG